MSCLSMLEHTCQPLYLNVAVQKAVVSVSHTSLTKMSFAFAPRILPLQRSVML